MSVSNVAKRRGQMLDEIMQYHREQLPKTMREVSFENVRALAAIASPPADLYAALKAPGVSLIAECKKASPSKGLLVKDYDAAKLARVYVKAGAKAISVLTDGRHFQGALQDLTNVKTAVGTAVPVLRKDFIFHPYQVYEARAAGADAILLITAVLGDSELRDLLQLAHQLQMQALVEVHTAEEIARVLPIGPRIIGVNNRNLQTFKVDFDNTARLCTLLPSEVAKVGESGLKTSEDVQAMRTSGVDAVLIGETLVRSKDVYQTTRRLVEAGRP